MVTKVNLDFSSSIKQIDELKSAAEAFGRVIQDVLNTSSRFGGIVNQTMAGVNQANLGTSSAPAPFAGSNADLLGNVREKLKSNQQQISDFFRAHPGAKDVGDGRFKYTTAQGSGFKNLTPLFKEQKELKSQEKDLQKVDEDQKHKEGLKGFSEQVRSTVESRQAVDKFKTGTNFNFSTLGYSMSDLPGMIASSAKVGDRETGDLKKLAETIKGLQESGDKNSHIAADVLKDISKSLREAQGGFTKALEEFSNPDTTSTPEKQRAATEKLVEAMARLDQTMSQAKDAARGAKQLPGGGGGGGSEDPQLMGLPFGRATQLGKGLLAAAGVAVGAVKFGQEMSIGLGRAVVGGQFDRIINQGTAAEQRFKDVYASQDMTDVENIFRFRGDMLLGKKQQFLGPTGFSKALGISADKQRMELNLLKQERDRDLLGAKGDIGLGLLQVLGGGAAALLGGPVGWVAGGAAMLSGGKDILAGGKGLINTYTQSPYSQLSGDLGTGLTGAMGRMMYGPQFSSLAGEKQQALMEEMRIKQYADARRIQDAEMQKLRPLMAGYQEIMNTIETQQEGAVLVGKYAQRGRENISRRVGLYTEPAQYYMEAVDRHTETRIKQEDKAEGDKLQHTLMQSTNDAKYVKAKENSASLSIGETTKVADLKAASQRLSEERNYDDDLVKRTIIGIESAGQVKVKNPETSAYGQYQFIRSTANTIGKRIGVENAYDQMVNLPEAESKELQDKMFDEHYKDLKAPVERQQRLKAGRFLPKQILVGLNQLGPLHVQRYLETGEDKTGGQIAPYIEKLSKKMNVQVPDQFYANIKEMQGERSDFINKMATTKTLADSGITPPQSESALMNYAGAKGLTLPAMLEMSSAEFDRHQNQLTNVLGGSRVASDSQTGRMIQLGRSGLGDFSSLLGNVAGLNRAVGGQDNTGRLETILGNAVAAGFDKSRTAQAFTQSVTQLAEQTGITGTEGLAGTLRVAAGGYGLGGVADEKSLREAAAGVGQYASYTSQKSNITGILGTIAGMQSGLTFGKGGGITMGMSNPELVDAIEQLKSGNVTNPKVQDLLRTSGQSKENLSKSLENVYKNKSSYFEHMLKHRGNFDVQKYIKDSGIRDLDLNTKGGQDKFRSSVSEAMSRAREAGSLSDIGEGGAMAYVAEQFRLEAKTPDAKALINSQIKSSPFSDPGKQQMRAFIDSLTANANVQNKFGVGGVNADERNLYFKSLEMGGQASVISQGKYKGQVISQETFEKGDKEFQNAANKELGNLNRLDIIRNTNYAAAVQNQNIQQVYITNFEDMLAINLKSDEIKRNINK